MLPVSDPVTDAPFDAARDRRRSPQRIVVKLGTNVVIRPDGRLALGLLCGLVESIAALRQRGHEVLVVSSGAVGLGMERLGWLERPRELSEIQACAAIGQSRLMAIYEDAFDRLGCRIAQVLLTEDDFRSEHRYSNLRHTLQALLRLGVIPVVNENDTVSTQELDRPSIDGEEPAQIFGDNDKLSALLSTHIDAELLILLSDVDGLYDRHPSQAGAQLLARVDELTPEVFAHAQGGNGRGRGGMSSKLEAARMATDAGLTAVIANGRTPEVLEQILGGLLGEPGVSVGTIFLPRAMAAQKAATYA